MERRLAAILAADVVGYSRLMGEDETGTLDRLKRYRAEFIDPQIADHNGRIVKLMGDGALVEFASAVEAVACAIGIQRRVADENATGDGQQILFRIGINVGDIIVEGDDIYGDGVNVAARLEGLADPGGICISRTVRDQIRDRSDTALDDLGEVEVKNIARPVRVFRVLLDGAARQSPVRTGLINAKRPGHLAAAVVLIMILLAAGAIGWLMPWQDSGAPSANSSEVGIAVLPFANMSGDPGQDYFSDGITEDLISDLSRISGLFVIARSTMFTYKDRRVGAHKVGEELGVPYVLEGSVRRSGGQVRINAQLIETASKSAFWSDRYDRALTDVFALQDEVTQRIAAALTVKLTKEESERLARPKKVDHEAYDTFLKGLAALRRYSRGTIDEAKGYFEKAAKLDPGYARAYAALAYSHAFAVLVGWSTNPAADTQRALELIQRAIELDDTLPQVHFARSTVYRSVRQHEEAIASARRAIALDHNYADGYAALAISLNYAGYPDEGIAAIRKSMRLNPRFSFFEIWGLAQGYFLLGRYEDAALELQKVVERNPSFVQGHKLLAATYGQLNRLDDAQWEADEIVNLLPGFRIRDELQRTPFEAPGRDLYIEGLRKAGVPE